MLEELDKKMLYSLDEDSSKSLTHISQELEITPQLVKYHLEKLEKEGIILAYWPMIEFRKLGYFNVSYFLKLKNLSLEIEKNIYQYLKNKNDFNIVMRGDGYWDLHITISTKSIFRSVEIFNEFYDKFHHYIFTYDTAISVGFYQFRREYLNDKKSIKQRSKIPMAYTGADVAKVELKKKDLEIISELNRNSRQNYADLAKKLKISRDSVIYSLEKIKKDEIIQSHTYLLNHEKIGFPRYRILVQMTNLTSEKFQDFFDFCQDHPNIIHLLRLFGNWQALIDVEIENREKLRKLFGQITNNFDGLVLRLENTQVYKIDKFRDVPFDII
ncbi:MAG: Lrp/AsnC family transcriptional regulator [Parcubacteria group bacterium]|jgi:DNA-binding Lrp family transcriptional regulator